MNEYDVIIIGSGPGGYAAGVSACAAGLKTALVEKEYLGGTCVNWGCIPTKALIRYAKLRHGDEGTGAAPTYQEANAESLKIARERREHIQALLEKNGGSLYAGTARLVSANEVEIAPSGEKIRGKNILIATGSTARRLPIAEYGESIVTTREALLFQEAPKSVVVVGSGATGIELATVWNRFGSQVTVFEMLPFIMGLGDTELSEAAKAHFRSEGMTVETEISVEKIAQVPGGAEVTYKDAQGSHTMTVEKVLVAAGVVPNSQGLGLEELGVDIQRGYIQIDDEMRTSVPNIYAVGDVTGKLALAYAATKQAKAAIVAIAGGKPPKIVYENIPRCIFSAIESAAAGLNEKQARDQGYEVEIHRGKIASHDGRTVPFGGGEFKLVADGATGKALGITMLGVDAADKIAGASRLINLGAPAGEVIDTVCSGR